MKIVKKSTENCHHFTAVENRCILHGRVFVMCIMSRTISMKGFIILAITGAEKHTLISNST